jgi:tRNA1Val (adenine37-N6)-methyltransferase
VSLASALLVEYALDCFDNAPLSVLDMGCGCGIVSIMCALSRPKWQILGIDIQSELIELALANAASCELDISFRQEDLRAHSGSYDLILANPPWQKAGSGMLSPHMTKNLSRVELSCTMQDLLEAIRRCLQPGASAIVIYPETRIDELEQVARETSLDITGRHSHFGKKTYFCIKLGLGTT